VHWPTAVAVNVLPLTEQAAPPTATAQVTAPPPLPPVAARLAVPPKATVAGLADATSGACASGGRLSVPPVVEPGSMTPVWVKNAAAPKASETGPAVAPAV